MDQDNEMYHLVGYLSYFAGNNINFLEKLKEEYRKKTKEEFKSDLKKKIKEALKIEGDKNERYCYRREYILV